MAKYAALILLAVAVGAVSSAVEKQKRGHSVTVSDTTPDKLLNEADSLFRQADYDDALARYEAAANLAQEEFNRSIETEAVAQMARMNLILGNREIGEHLLDRAGGLADDSDPMGWSRYLSVKGRYEWKAGDLDSARNTFTELHAYCNANALWGRVVDAANMMSILADEPAEKIEWSRRGIEAAEAGASEELLGPLWNNLAITYYEQKQFAEALDGFLKAREYHWRYGREIQKLFADYHVGMAYRSLGQLDEAGRWLRPVLAWAERLEHPSAIGQALEDLGEIEIAQGNKAEGLKMLKRARENYRKADFEKEVPDVWKQINERITALGG